MIGFIYVGSSTLFTLFARDKVVFEDDDPNQVEEEELVMVQGQLNVHMGSKSPFCPKAKLDDGLLDVVIIRNAGSDFI